MPDPKTEWIAFRDQPPSDGHWIEAASADHVEVYPYLVGKQVDLIDYLTDRCGCTHWRLYQPPTDRPPRLRPELSGGSTWSPHFTGRILLASGDQIWLLPEPDGSALQLVVRPGVGERAITIPLNDIDALRQLESR